MIIDAWFDPGDGHAVWSVSECEDDGAEIRNLSGGDTQRAAWLFAKRYAKERKLVARLIDRMGQVVEIQDYSEK